jgi:hypothetical protein
MPEPVVPNPRRKKPTSFVYSCERRVTLSGQPCVQSLPVPLNRDKPRSHLATTNARNQGRKRDRPSLTYPTLPASPPRDKVRPGAQGKLPRSFARASCPGTREPASVLPAPSGPEAIRTPDDLRTMSRQAKARTRTVRFVRVFTAFRPCMMPMNRRERSTFNVHGKPSTINLPTINRFMGSEQ